MMRIDDEALVVDHRNYRDRHLLLEVLGRGHGLIRGVLRRARGGKNPAAGAAQVLAVVHVTGLWAPKAELATFYALESVRPSYALASDLPKAAAAAAVAELLRTFCVAAEPAERPFRLGQAALDALLAGTDPNLVVAYCQLWILILAGLQPADIEAGEDVPSDRAVRDLLTACRRQPVAQVRGPVPAAAAAWLDRRIRDEAERALPALDFLRRHAASPP